MSLNENINMLAKREETEKAIINEHNKVQKKLGHKKLIHKKELQGADLQQEESTSLNHQSALLSGQTSRLKIDNTNIQNDIVEIICEIDEAKSREKLALMVEEKEQKSLQLYYEEMLQRKNDIAQFWNEVTLAGEARILEERREHLTEERNVLEDQIQQLKVSDPKAKLAKLTEDCMNLRKRNTAFLRRKTMILEQLEQRRSEIKEELNRARRKNNSHY